MSLHKISVNIRWIKMDKMEGNDFQNLLPNPQIVENTEISQEKLLLRVEILK